MGGLGSWLWLGLAGWLWWPPAQAASASQSGPLPTIRWSGFEFVDFGAWAFQRQLKYTANLATREIQLTNRWHRLEFTLNSRQAEVDGVRVWLSLPVIQAGRKVYLSSVDARSLLGPILAPPKNKPGQRVRTIALDPGHGGRDAGFEIGSRQEKTHTLLLARKLRTLLQQAGFKVVLTRSADTYVELEQRPLIAKRARADLLISLHYNAAGGESQNIAKGAETYVISPAGTDSTNSYGDPAATTRAVNGNVHNHRSVLLGYQIQKTLTRRLKVEDRGLRRARFVVLRDADLPAVLVEAAFMSHPEDARRIYDPKQRDRLAQALLEAVQAYRRIVERK